MQVRWGTHGDHSIVCMTASNHQDLFEIVVDAFNIAETFRTPVVVLIDEVVGHMREPVRIPAEGEIALTERLVTAVPRDVDYHPYFPREDGRLPMSNNRLCAEARNSGIAAAIAYALEETEGPMARGDGQTR